MDNLIEEHRQDFDEIRKLCLQCHGLDLTSSHLFTHSAHSNPSDATKIALQSLISGHLLRLAIAIRINLYQGNIQNSDLGDNVMSAGYYELGEGSPIVTPASIKDVCDKIIHAENLTKSTFPPGLIDRETTISFQLTGSYRKKKWVLDLSLEIFTEVNRPQFPRHSKRLQCN